jgi:hypothetical protein
VLTNLKNWDKLFDSPFKSDVYFFSTRVQTGRKWGTPQPITIRDKDFDMIRVRAFGMYSYRVADARAFFTEISGTRDAYTRDEVEDQLRGIMLASMASTLRRRQRRLPRHGGQPGADGAAGQGRPEPGFRALRHRPGPIQRGQRQPAGRTAGRARRTHLGRHEGRLSADKMAGFTRSRWPARFRWRRRTKAAWPASARDWAPARWSARPWRRAERGVRAGRPAAAPAGEPIEERLGKLKGLLDKGLISQADYDSTKAELLKKLIG